MLRTILLLASSIFILNTALSQTVTKEKFEEAVDFVNCKVAELSMSDQEGTPNYSAFQSEFPNCDVTRFPNGFYPVLKSFLFNASVFKTELIAAIIELKKEEYNVGISAKEAYKIVTEDIFTHPSLRTFATKPKRKETFPAMMREIKTRVGVLFNIEVDLSEVSPATEKPIDTTETTTIGRSRDTTPHEGYRYMEGDSTELTFDERYDRMEEGNEEDLEAEEANVEEKSGLSRKIRVIALVLLLIVALTFFIYQKRLFAFDGGDIPLMSNKGNTVSEKEVEGIKKELDDLRKYSDSLQEELNYLQVRVGKLEDQNSATPPPLIPSAEKVENKRVPIKTLPPEVKNPTPKYDKPPLEIELSPTISTSKVGKTIYLPLPNPDGTFDAATALSNFKRPNSVYEFTLTSEDGTAAEFEVYGDIATMIRALSDFDRYLKPACKSNSIIHITAMKVITEEKGKAVKENGQWKVVKKAVVRYG